MIHVPYPFTPFSLLEYLIQSLSGACHDNRGSHCFGFQVKYLLTIRVFGERFYIVMAVETYHVKFIGNLDVGRDDASGCQS